MFHLVEFFQPGHTFQNFVFEIIPFDLASICSILLNIVSTWIQEIKIIGEMYLLWGLFYFGYEKKQTNIASNFAIPPISFLSTLVICSSSRKTNINYEAGDKYIKLVYCVG